jgi:hypothetical protein
MAVEGGLDSSASRIIAVGSYCFIMMRNWEVKYLLVKLLFTFHKSEEFDYISHCKFHAMGILSIGDIVSRYGALYFARSKREIHLRGGHEIGGKDPKLAPKDSLTSRSRSTTSATKCAYSATVTDGTAAAIILKIWRWL